jgi:ABC-type multidrug transport system fused ATPase/permease subunit
MEWAATAATALVAVQVSFRLVSGSLDFATALAVLVLTPEFFLPLRRLALEYHTGQSAEAAARRIGATLGPRGGDGDGAAPAHGHQGLDLRETTRERAPRPGVGVELHEVWLTRNGGRRAVLRGASLSIGAGEVVALTGESGVGKSSIAGLLLGFWSPDAGRILVDGVDLGELDVTHWRRRVAWVPQSPTVFAGTVAHNIALGEPDASPHRIRRAAERAGLHEVIRTLPHGYDTVLGEGGGTLSGGERQRLAIARAVLRDAPLVVFDEFTAQLDPDTEQEVLESARWLLRGRSALVIAHRPATIAMADRVVRVADGRVLPGTAPHPAEIPTDVAP